MSPFRRLAPGLVLTILVATAAWGLVWVETRRLGHTPLDAVVLAILVGLLVRRATGLRADTEPGVTWAGRELLKLSVVTLGLGADLTRLAGAGLPLASATVVLVLTVLVIGSWIGRRLGLAPTHALLIASGNAICGNSAIAAVAPVLGARAEEVASAVAFTAVLSVPLVLGFPMLASSLGVTESGYGVLVGLSVYAVPQVLAAALPVGPIATQVGMTVKLVRVALLGPLAASLGIRSRSGAVTGPRPPFLPWFLVGFGAAAACRTAGLVPDALAAVGTALAHLSAVLAMAALGLGVDLGTLRRAGWRVAVTVVLSLLLMVLGSVVVVRTVPLP